MRATSIRPLPTRVRGIALWSITRNATTACNSRGSVAFFNPPFDRSVVPCWVRKLARHGCGTALLHARTETDWFEPIWETATAILFMADQLSFHQPDGTRQPANSGAPPVLVAFGSDDAEPLKASGIPGAFVPSNWTWRPPKARSAS